MCIRDRLERARLIDRKHLDRQLLVAAQRERRGVHDFQAADDGFVEADARIARGGRILVGIRAVDAVDLGGLQHDLRTDLGATQGGRGIGREERIAGARGEDDDLAFFEVTQGLGCLLYTSRCV